MERQSRNHRRRGRFDQSDPPAWVRVGIGRIERPSDSHTARASAEFTNAIQRWVLDNTRLGKGTVPKAAVDEAVRRLLHAKFIVGLFEDPFVDPEEADQISGAADARSLPLEAAPFWTPGRRWHSC